jgi:MFS family permease
MIDASRSLSLRGRILVLFAGFFGWMLAGVQLGLTSIVMRDAAKGLLGTSDEAILGQWFGWLTSSFMLGAALGGYLFGWIGDRLGRKTGMAFSIACYSLAAGLTGFVTSPSQLLIGRFIVGLGVGGMWPNGIALVAEAWPNMSRPMLAGVIGTAANVGIMCFSILTCFVFVTPDAWRWTMQMSFAPILLAVFVAFAVPESPRWLTLKKSRAEPTGTTATKTVSPLVEVFQRPILRYTILGIALGTVPLFGGWGNSNWANAWAAQVGDRSSQQTDEQGSQPTSNPALKAQVLLARSAPGSLASLLGGAVATLVGRRRFYFFLSIACLFCAQSLFWTSHPSSPDFLWWTGALGLFSGFYFGWLPLYLPELFPTRVRSTGAGVSFNFGRIGTVFGILVAAGLLKTLFNGDYAAIGRLTSWIYAFGAVVILFAPDTAGQDLED